MDYFSEQLKRLKHALRVSKDQEVAGQLGMSPTAFSERKKRGSFPIRELHGLAAKRPDLQLDVDYVLTGITAEARGRLDALEGRISRAVDAGADVAEVRALERRNDPASVEAILPLLRRCRPSERAAIFTLAMSIVQLREELEEGGTKKGDV